MNSMQPSVEANVNNQEEDLQQTRIGAQAVRFLAGLCALFFAAHLIAADARPDRTNVGDLDVTMKDVDGAERRPFDLSGDKASVLFFVLHDCPIANAYSPEIRRIVEAYEKEKVRFALVYVDPDMKSGDIRKHRKEFGHEGYPAIFDKRHVLVKATGADVTPEVAVIAGEGQIAYRGRINNLYADYGKRRRVATEHDLRDALDAVLAGKPVGNPRTKALGCFIPKTE